MSEEPRYVEYTKDQCLYALKTSAENCRLGNMVCLAPEVVIGIFNYLSDGEKLYLVRNKKD